MKISFRCSYENLVVFCLCVCVLLLLLLRIWGMLLGRRWKWPSVRLNACRTFSRRRRFYPAHFFFFSLCSSLVFPPSVTQDFAYVYKTEATDWLSFFFSSTDCMWRYYEKLSRRKTAGEMLHARTFFFFSFLKSYRGKIAIECLDATGSVYLQSGREKCLSLLSSKFIE